MIKRQGRKITEAEREKFLEVLAETCNAMEAARQVGRSARSFYSIAKREPEFNERYQDALEIVKGKIEQEIFRRGIDGVEKPIMYQGKPVGMLREYSDRMLEMMAYAYIPEKYTKVVKQEITGKDGKDLIPEDKIAIARRLAYVLSSAAREKQTQTPETATSVSSDDGETVH